MNSDNREDETDFQTDFHTFNADTLTPDIGEKEINLEMASLKRQNALIKSTDNVQQEKTSNFEQIYSTIFNHYIQSPVRTDSTAKKWL